MDNRSFEILYEDNDILVAVKPARVPSQSDRTMDYDMVSRAKNYLAQKGEDTYIAIINRLDRPVKGITLFAKNKKAAAILSEAMKSHDFGKFYKATIQYDNQIIINGKCVDIKEMIGKEIVLEDYLKKDGKNNISKVVDKQQAGAKLARLKFVICQVDENEKTAQVNIELFTGRHHQIRAQFSHAGMPLLGDTKYGKVTVKRGQFVDVSLEAYKMNIRHPITKKEMCFELK